MWRTYGQWLQMNATTSTGCAAKSLSATVAPVVEGRLKSGAGVPSVIGGDSVGTPPTLSTAIAQSSLSASADQEDGRWTLEAERRLVHPRRHAGRPAPALVARVEYHVKLLRDRFFGDLVALSATNCRQNRHEVDL